MSYGLRQSARQGRANRGQCAWCERFALLVDDLHTDETGGQAITCEPRMAGACERFLPSDVDQTPSPLGLADGLLSYLHETYQRAISFTDYHPLDGV